MVVVASVELAADGGLGGADLTIAAGVDVPASVEIVEVADELATGVLVALISVEVALVVDASEVMVEVSAIPTE